jgi:uncharacterized protein YdaU (DUF1376 family)
MADFPCLPFWTDAYLADTNHLTTEEHGAYLLLLIEAWRSPDCSLPDDDALLARHAGLSPAKWKASKPIIMAFWKLDGRRGRWFQKRLRKERQKVAQKRRAAKDSAASRWKQTKTGHANAMPTQSYPEPEHTSKAKAFSERASAQKPTRSAWVSPRTTNQAAASLIEEIDNGFGRTEGRNEITGEALRLLPAVRTG